MSGRIPKVQDADRARPRVCITFAIDTLDRLDQIALVTGVGRGRIVDAMISHADRCTCEVCHAVRSQKK